MRNKLILLLSLSALGFSLSSIAGPFSRRNCCCQTEEVQEVVEREVIEKCDGETNSAGICIPKTQETVVETKPVYTETKPVVYTETTKQEVIKDSTNYHRGLW